MGDQVVVLLINEGIAAVIMVRDQTLDQIKQEVLSRWSSRMYANAKVQIVVANVVGVETMQPAWQSYGCIAPNMGVRIKE